MHKFSQCRYKKNGAGQHRRRFGNFPISAIRYVLIMAIITSLVLSSDAVTTASESKVEGADPDPDNDPIEVTADQLISNNDEMFAEFIGNVKASQGNFVITSDKLRIYYQGDLLKSKKRAKDEDLVKKIEATGNVKIESEQFSAETDKLEYDTATMTYVLTGDNSKILSGKNFVSGSKITFHQKDRQFNRI